MRAITLYQPWASLIAEGVKTIETRPQRSPWHTAVGETVAIHAAVRAPVDGLTLGDWRVFFREHMTHPVTGQEVVPDAWLCGERGGASGKYPFVLPLGAVVATARIDAVVPMVDYDAPNPRSGPLDSLDLSACLDVHGDALTYWWHPDGGFRDVSDQRPFGDYAPGRWAILLSDIRKLHQPIRCRGYQGLWTVPADVERTVGSLSSST